MVTSTDNFLPLTRFRQPAKVSRSRRCRRANPGSLGTHSKTHSRNLQLRIKLHNRAERPALAVRIEIAEVVKTDEISALRLRFLLGDGICRPVQINLAKIGFFGSERGCGFL